MKIWHNNRCSKSRSAIQLLEEKGVKYEVYKYLDNSPSKEELIELLKMLNISAEQLIRKGEAVFKEQFKGKELNENEWVQAMVEYPKLIERPILVNNGKAVIGRPPENILDII